MVHLGPKKPPARKGSMADVPPNLLEQVHALQTLFSVSAEKMRAIVKHFVSELDKGLSKQGGNIPMIPTWVVEYPTGKETGEFLALDFGGTNVRVVLVKLGGNRDFDITQSNYKLPDTMRTGTSEQLWSFIANCLKEFVDELYPDGVTKSLPLGFTFSYPASQNKINSGILQRWTKGYDIKGVEGKDVVPMLQEQIEKLKIPIEVVALINDTTGTLVASLYSDPNTKMGIIIGTGVNGAYYEVAGNIPKLEGKLPADIDADSAMAINCEYGSFDNEHLVLPRTKYDVIIDEQSPKPGQQAFEKMTSGYYLGEIMRLVMLDLHDMGFILQNQDISLLKKPYIMDTSFPSRIEDDPFENLENTYDLLKSALKIETTVVERKLIRKLAEFVGTRAARLTVCGVSAICDKRGYKTAHIAADGSVFNKYPGYKEKAAQALKDIYDWKVEKMEDHPIKLVAAEDGSGVGAAIIAALTQKRLAAGKSIGMNGA